jgi:hypothetical protein
MNYHSPSLDVLQRAISHSKRIGGQLLFLILVLTILAPFFTGVEFTNFYQLGFEYLTRSSARAIGTIVIVLGDLITRTYGVYAGIKLWRIEPNAVRTGKRYFILNIVICIIQLFFVGQVVQEGLREQQTQEAVRELILAIGVSGWWYIYLNKSQRVRDTYGPNVERHRKVTGVSPSQTNDEIRSPIKSASFAATDHSSSRSTALPRTFRRLAIKRPHQIKPGDSEVQKTTARIPGLNTLQRIAVWAGLMIGVVMIVWPPWLAAFTSGQEIRTKFFGYRFISQPASTDELDRLTELFPVPLAIFDEPKDRIVKAGLVERSVTYRIDFRRLSIQFGMLVIGIAGLIWVLARERS